MKKLLAITVIFALVAGAAFAETSFGGGFRLGTDLLSGKGGETTTRPSDDGKENLAGEYQWWNAGSVNQYTELNFSVSGDNAGGDARITGGHSWARLWWKPIDILKVGFDKADGIWGHDAIVGWGFNAGAKDIPALDEQSNWVGAFAGGHSGLYLELTPIEALTVGIGVPVFDGEDDAENIWLRTKLDIKFALDGIGVIKARANFGPGRNDRIGTGNLNDAKTKYLKKRAGEKEITDAAYASYFETTPAQKAEYDKYLEAGSYADYASGHTGTPLTAAQIKTINDAIAASAATYASTEVGTLERLPFDPAADNTSFHLAFELTAIDNLGVELGFGLTLPSKWETKEGTDTVTYKYTPPVKIGLGAKYGMDAFNVKFAFGIELGAKYENDAKKTPGLKDDEYSKWKYEKAYKPRFNFALLPSFKINDDFEVFLNTALFLTVNEYEWQDKDSKYKYFNATQAAWLINPYVRIGISNGNFWAGVKIADNGKIVQGTAGGGDDYLSKTKKENTLEWSIPIGINLSF